MPKCKGDPSRTYTGSEPSPKGLGHCAHMFAAGTRKKGRDGAMWEAQVDKNGRIAWRRAARRAPTRRIGRASSK